MELLALLSSGKGTWGQVVGLINNGKWDKIILLGDDYAKEFRHNEKFEFIKIDTTKRLKELRDEILEKLKGKIKAKNQRGK